MNQTPSGLSIPDLETVYDQLATALDAVGPDKTELFLVKLVLLQAQALGHSQAFAEHVTAAQRDL